MPKYQTIEECLNNSYVQKLLGKLHRYCDVVGVSPLFSWILKSLELASPNISNSQFLSSLFQLSAYSAYSLPSLNHSRFFTSNFDSEIKKLNQNYKNSKNTSMIHQVNASRTRRESLNKNN